VSPADRARKLARAWRVVVARARRQLKLSRIEYLAVFEATKRGEPHLHILVRSGFIPQRWLSAQMRDLVGSPVVDIRLVRSARQAAAYVSKYIGKAPHRFATCKRYWKTRGWDLSPKRTDQDPVAPGGDWIMVDQRVDVIAADWRSRGFYVNTDGRHRAEFALSLTDYEARQRPRTGTGPGSSGSRASLGRSDATTPDG
jgi:hypothetical protein